MKNSTDLSVRPLFERKFKLSKSTIMSRFENPKSRRNLLIIIGIILILIFVIIFTVRSCSSSTSNAKKIYGEWSNLEGSISYNFKMDGTFSLYNGTTTADGTYKILKDQLQIAIKVSEDKNLFFTFDYVLSNDTLSMTNEEGKVDKLYRKESDIFKKVMDAVSEAEEILSSATESAEPESTAAESEVSDNSREITENVAESTAEA